jgi:CIC family chloride channel protein
LNDTNQSKNTQPVSARQWNDFIRDREEQVFLVLTLVIGALVGMAVVAFIVITERFGAKLYPADGAAWRRILVPVVGSLGMGYLLFKYFPEARGSGVPQTKAALFAREGHISLKTVLGKFFCTSATVASGIPLGREGPAVQVGAGIASVLGRRLGLRDEKIMALVPVGAAAAIAAAFNTPLAAVLFTLEEIVGDLHAPVLGSVVLASATSWVVLRLFLGNEPLFQVPSYQLVHPVEFGIYAVLGLIGGLMSAAFTIGLTHARKFFLRLPQKSGWLQPVAGGITVGIMGWFIPQILGVGYKYVGDALNGTMALRLMALLLVLKLISVVISYASGNAGGIFGPSLFMGAMLGGAIGNLAHHYFPGHVGTQGAYALVGMGTAFAGIIRAPMTSVVMIFEITRDYAVIVPLMIANLVSYFVASRFQKQQIYEVLAHQDGIHLPTKETKLQEGTRQVRHAMRAPELVLQADWKISQAQEVTRTSKQRAWPVMDERGFLGIIRLKDLQSAVASGNEEKPLEDLFGTGDLWHLHPDHSLSAALDRMGAANVDVLPVVSRANIRELEGIVTLGDVLDRYGVSTKK